MSAEDRAALRALNQEHEALSWVIARETSVALDAAVEPSQRRVRAVIEEVGGEVESGFVAVNALVAQVPAWSIRELAAVPLVARVVSDKVMRGGLTYADDATLVTTDAGDGSLWTAWVSWDGETDCVVASRRQDDAWQDPVRLSGDTTDHWRPALACDGDGRLWFTWSANQDGNWDLWACCLDGGQWSLPQRLTDNPHNDFSQQLIG